MRAVECHRLSVKKEIIRKYSVVNDLSIFPRSHFCPSKRLKQTINILLYFVSNNMYQRIAGAGGLKMLIKPYSMLKITYEKRF